MDKVFLMLTCCLSLAFTEPTTENGLMKLQNTSTLTGQDTVINSTNSAPLNSSEHLNISTTPIADNKTITTQTPTTTASASSHSPTSESTTAEVPFTKTHSTDVTTATQTETSARHTVHSTSGSHTTTAAVTTTANSSVVNATSHSGVRLSLSERNLTITFSVMLGIFALAVVAIKLHRWSYKLQFLHQPLNNTEDMNVSTADPDTLVISGGLYDGHPIYDHVPPARQDESQFRLEFLH